MTDDLDVPLLGALRRRAGDWCDGPSLGRELAALQPELERFRRFGAQVETDPARGVRLLSWPNRLHPDLLAWELEVQTLGRRILVYQETSSTQDLVWRLAAAGEPEGVALFAESQTRGRGRRGRAWQDAPGKALCLSVLLTPRLPPEATQVLTVFSAVAVCEALEAVSGHAAAIKWPNDVLLNRRKAAGILIETRPRSAGAEEASVLGIGINVNQEEHEWAPELRRQATSLRAVTGREQNRIELARALLQRLDRRYQEVQRQDVADLEAAWRHRCTALSQVISLREDDRVYTGRVVDLDLRAGLILQLTGGGLRAFRGEHVTVLPG